MSLQQYGENLPHPQLSQQYGGNLLCPPELPPQYGESLPCPPELSQQHGGKDSSCFPEEINFRGRAVHFKQHFYEDVNDFLARLLPGPSVCVAQCFAETTGIVRDVRCKIPMANLPGVLPRLDMYVRYDVLAQCLQLLGVLNSQFVDYDPPFDKNSSFNVKVTQEFADYLVRTIEKHDDGESDMIDMIKCMINYMKKESAAHASIVEHFCNVYAPYVKNMLPQHRPSSSISSTVLWTRFEQVHRDANDIRQTYSPYSVHFELIYVFIYSYLFSDDLEVVCSLVLNLLSKVFGGYFVSPQLDESRRYLESQLKKTRNSTGLCRRVINLQREGCREHISIELLKDMEQLREIFEQHFEKFWCQKRRASSEEELAYACSQTFPYLLFTSDVDYFGYMFAIPIMASHFDKRNSVFTGNTVASCKSVIDFVGNFIKRFQKFQAAKDVDYWTPDMFKMFISSDEHFEESFQKFFQEFIVREKYWKN